MAKQSGDAQGLASEKLKALQKYFVLFIKRA
jgi:hypothetical protein